MISPPRARRALLAFLVILPAYGWVAWQAFGLWRTGTRRIESAVPLPAAIVQSALDSQQGALGRTFFRPRITYAIRTDTGMTFRTQVTPLNEASTRGWALAIVDRYRVGQVDTAWVDTTTRESFLVREVGTFWYWTVGAGLVLLGALAWLLQRARRPAVTP